MISIGSVPFSEKDESQCTICGEKNGPIFFEVLMKEFLSLNQQIKLLNKRGLIINSPSFAKEKLKRYNYYNLINGFKYLILSSETKQQITEKATRLEKILAEVNDGLKTKDEYELEAKIEIEEKYIPELTFEEVFSIYEFDTKLRVLILKYITMIESEVRTHIAYDFSEQINPYDWDVDTSFDNIHRELLNEMLENIQKLVSDERPNPIKEHFANKNEKMPIWAFINIFDFGLLRSFYQNLKQPLRLKISKDYYKLSDDTLISFLSALNMYRNVCAHDNRILFYRIHSKNKRIANTVIHKNLKIHKNESGIYQRGKNDLFSILIVFRYMLHPDNFNRFFVKITNLFSELKNNLDKISINEIYNSLGFPIGDKNQLDWIEILNVSKF